MGAGRSLAALSGLFGRVFGSGEPAPPPGDDAAAAPEAGSLEHAAELCRGDRWDEACDVLRLLATPQCRCERTWRALGVAHGRRGDWRRAQGALERAGALGADQATAGLLGEVRAVRRGRRA